MTKLHGARRHPDLEIDWVCFPKTCLYKTEVYFLKRTRLPSRLFSKLTVKSNQVFMGVLLPFMVWRSCGAITRHTPVLENLGNLFYNGRLFLHAFRGAETFRNMSFNEPDAPWRFGPT